MDSTQEILSTYLQEPSSDYCLMLDGEWGIGKSYYWHKTLVPMIDEIKVPGKECTYKQISISLFGIDSLQDLRNKILKELFLPLKTKAPKLTGRLFDTIFRFAGKVSFNTHDIFNLVALYPVDLKKYVVCLDDLERLQDELFVPVLGFINEIIERQHIKVLLICNDKKCADKPHYTEYKEKLVRYTCYVNNDIKQVAEYLSTTESDPYKTFIFSKAELIAKLFGYGGCKNIRTLKFIIESFRRIYLHIRQNVEKDYLESVAEYFLYIYVVYCLEYHKEDRNIENLRFLSRMTQGNINNIDFWGFVGDEKEKQETKEKTKEQQQGEYLEGVRKHYFPAGFFFHGASRALIEYVFTGEPYFGTFIHEEKEILNSIKDQELTEEAKLLKRLYGGWENEDEEMELAVEEAIDGVRQARYKLSYYPLILLRLQLLQKFGFAEFDLSGGELIRIFNEAVEKCPVEFIDSHFYSNTDFDENITNEYKELKAKVLGRSKDALQKERNKAFSDLLNEFEVNQDLSQFERCYFPIFRNIDVRSFFEWFMTLKNKTKRKVLVFFDSRYEDQQMIVFDAEFLFQLDQILQNYLGTAKPAPSTVYCKKLHERIEKLISNLQKQ